MRTSELEFETVEQRTKKLDLRYIKPKKKLPKKKLAGASIIAVTLTFFFSIILALQDSPPERTVPTTLSFLSEPSTTAHVSAIWSYLVVPSNYSAEMTVETSVDWGLTVSGWSLSGTPKYWSIGIYDVSLSLHNGRELAWQNFSIEVVR